MVLWTRGIWAARRRVIRKVDMDKYIQEDSGPTVAIEIEESVFGELETIGMLQEIVDYVSEAKTTVTFNHTAGGSIHTDPVFYKGVIYFNASDKNLYAISPDGEKIWTFKCGDIPFHITIENDIIYFGCYDKNLYTVSLEGGLLWKFATNGKVVSRPFVKDGKIYFGSEDGNLYAISAKGELVWKFNTQERVFSAPVVYKNMVIFGAEDKNVYALDPETGEMIWKFPGNAAMGSPVVYKDVIYVVSYDHNLYALDLTGRLLWKFTTTAPISYKECLVVNDVIYFANDGGVVYALGIDGKVIWKFQTKGKINFITLVLHDGVIYFGSHDFKMYALDAKTGKRLWAYGTKNIIISKPVIYDNKLYFGSWDCNFYCLSFDGKLVWKLPTSTSKLASVDVPATTEKKVSRFIMKLQDVERKAYRTSSSTKGQIGGTYSLDIGYKTEHEYKGGRKYGK